MGLAKYSSGFEVALHPESLLAPLRWKRPRLVFVNSTSDLFHEAVPFEFVDRVWAAMALCPQHRFQVLTKRPGHARAYLEPFFGPHCDEAIERVRDAAAAITGDPRAEGLVRGMNIPLDNVWLGTSIESALYAGRAETLRAAPAAVRFLSLEPLLGPLPDLDLSGNWLGHRRRRVGTGSSADGSRVGEGHPGHVHFARGAVLLQAVGRYEQEARRPSPRRPDLGRDAFPARRRSGG